MFSMSFTFTNKILSISLLYRRLYNYFLLLLYYDFWVIFKTLTAIFFLVLETQIIQRITRKKGNLLLLLNRPQAM